MNQSSKNNKSQKALSKSQNKAIDSNSNINNTNQNKIGVKALRLKVTAKELMNFPVIGEAILPKQNIYYDYICYKNKRQDTMKMREMKPTTRNEPKVNIFNKITQLRTKINDNHELIAGYSPVIFESRRAIDEITIGYDKLKGMEKSKAKGLIRPDPMEDIIKEYHNRKVKLPKFRSIVKENIFKQNPLLQIGSELHKYYMFYREKPVEKRVNKYLRKVNCIYNQKIIPDATERELQRVLNQNKDIEENELALIEEKPIDIEKERKVIQKDINQLGKTIDDMESMDEFYMTRRRRFEGQSRNIGNSTRNSANAYMNDQSAFDNNKENSTTTVSRKLTQSRFRNQSFDMNSPGFNRVVMEKDKKNSNLSIDYLYNECSSNSIYKNNFSELIKEYAKWNHINVSSQSTNEDLIKHLKQMRKSVLVRNYIMEDYNIRRDKNYKLELSQEQKEVLEQNRVIEQGIRKSEDQTLKIFLRQTVDD